MIEEVKKIIVERYEEEYKRASKEYYDRTTAILMLEGDLHTLERETMYPVVKKHFSLIQRFLTKREEYREYREEQEEYSQKSQKADEIRTKLSTEKPRLEKEIKELKLKEKLQAASEKLEKAKNAQVIKDLGINLFEAFSILKENDIPIVLTEADKVETEVERDYSSKSALIGVHKTQFAPTDSKIKTAKDAKAISKAKIIINEQEYEYEYMSERDTVHMAMNDEVSSHMYGSWEDCKYSVLIPMSDISNEKIGYANSVDTFTKGSLNLSQNCWILCPISEVEQMKHNNPGVNVIGYEGESVLGYSSPFLSALGYRAEDVGMWSWYDEESKKQFAELMEQEGLKIAPHSDTYFHEDENALTEINSLVSICNIIKNNGLLKNADDIPDMIEQLSETQFYWCIESLCGGSRFDNGEYPDAVKGNHRHLDIFFSKMQENGFELSDNYKTIFRRIDQIGIGSIYDESDTKQLFEGLDNLSENEKKALEVYKSSLSSFGKYDSSKYSDSVIKFMSAAVLDSVERSKERITINELDTEQADDLDR